MKYTVIWRVDVEANSPQEAADIALRIQRNQFSDEVVKPIETVDLLLKDLGLL